MPRWAPWVWSAIVLAAYAAGQAVVWYASVTMLHPPSWRAALPIPVAPHGIAHPDLVEAAMLLLGAIETYALLGLYRTRISFALIAAGFAGLTLISIASPAFVSPDAYAYVGNAVLGLQSYAPPAGDLPGAYAVVNRLFGTPLPPAPYGPLWLAIARGVAAIAPTLGLKLLALRFFCAACFGGLLLALRAAGVSQRVLALAALNPAIAQQYVADAHNDLLAIVLVVTGAVLVRYGRMAAAAGVIAVAGLVKLPFVVLALPIFAYGRSRWAGYAAGTCAIAAALAVSWLSAGAPYFRGLMVHVPLPGPQFAANAAVTLVALTLLGSATIGGRRFRSAVWILPMAASYVAPWYATYGVPYALARRRIIAYLLVGLPLACALVDVKFMRAWTYAVVALVVVTLAWPNRRARELA